MALHVLMNPIDRKYFPEIQAEVDVGSPDENQWAHIFFTMADVQCLCEFTFLRLAQ